MVKRKMVRLAVGLAGVLAASGCGQPPDERLARYAQQSVQTQERQNEAQARQNEQMARSSQQIAEAAQELVARDAAARQELIEAQRQLQEEVRSERSSLDRQREGLELERRRIAEQRHRDPIIAAAIHGIGILLVCLLPLLVAIYALKHLGGDDSESDELSELLLEELADDRPRLPPPAASRVTALPGPPSGPTSPVVDQPGEDGVP